MQVHLYENHLSFYGFSQLSERSEGDKKPPAMRVEDKRLYQQITLNC